MAYQDLCQEATAVLAAPIDDFPLFIDCYSNKSRGLRLKVQDESQGDSAISYVPPRPKKACSKKWATA